MDISILIPTLNGGAKLEEALGAIARQKTARTHEVICVDSGSREADVEVMRRWSVRLHRIERSQFNHGLTRDLGASLAKGHVLVFLNQDAVPRDDRWLHGLTEPLFTSNKYAAVQGGILEAPDLSKRFFWDSCGQRFYFTRESERWLARYGGVGFSTVNAAIRREVWEKHPFGFAPIMEDKKWQKEIMEAGYEITTASGAAVLHTHNYDMRRLIQRCVSEGVGWRFLGERYRLCDALRDMTIARVYGLWLSGILQRRMRTLAELLFPWLRPILLYYGNRFARTVRA